uniref:hypothetical protein n=1 Tax=Hafnia alvei TaxID=569 RepID=UPI0026E92B66
MSVVASVIGGIVSIIGVILSYLTFLKANQDRVILAYDYIKILNEDMKKYVEFISDSIKICEAGIGTDNYNKFMLKTRLLDSYLSYFIYKKEHAVLANLKLHKDYKKLISDKEKIVSEIRNRIFNSRNKYREDKNCNMMIDIRDLNHFK